jgi:hypothetical protein
MSDDMTIEVCPETGICSIVRADASKIDLMPDEVAALREADGDVTAIKAVLAESDTAFAAGLSAAEITLIGQKLA